MIPFPEFKQLTGDEKNSEILRCLPMLGALGEDFARVKTAITTSLDKITQVGAAVASPSWSMSMGSTARRRGVSTTFLSRLATFLGDFPSLLRPQPRPAVQLRGQPAQRAGRREEQVVAPPGSQLRFELHLGGVPALLPDIALHTLAPPPYPGGHACQPLPWGGIPLTQEPQPTRWPSRSLLGHTILQAPYSEGQALPQEDCH